MCQGMPEGVSMFRESVLASLGLARGHGSCSAFPSEQTVRISPGALEL